MIGEWRGMIATIVLVSIAVLRCVRTGRKVAYTLVPMVLMPAVSVWVQIFHVKPMYVGLFSDSGGEHVQRCLDRRDLRHRTAC